MSDDLIWFHGKINREQAHHILSSAERRREGLFLVRETPNHPGTFVLSLWANGQDKHYQIQHHGDAHFAIDDGPVFQGVDDLIRHYKKKSDGLPTRLVEFCPGTYPPPAIRKRCETELHKAAYEGQAQIVRRLLGDSTGDLNGKNASGATPLHVAASRGHEDVVLTLVQQGADVRLRDNNGATPLQAACINGYSNICHILIHHGNADPQERSTTTGWVPLHEAAFRGHTECVKTLLTLGAPLHPRTPDGDTPKDLAQRYGRTKVLALLDKHVIPPSATQKPEWLHQKIDRRMAVDYLNQYGLSDGLFLVRMSGRSQGCHALSVVVRNQIYHYEIQVKDSCWYYIDDGPLFRSLEHVIDYYMHRADGLPTQLKTPLGPSRVARLHKTVERSRSGPPSKSPPPLPEEDDADDYSKLNEWEEERPPAPTPKPWPANRKSVPVRRQSPAPAAVSSSNPALIDRAAVVFESELGQGEFGSVMKGLWTNPEGQTIAVAVKTLRSDALGHGEQEFLREARVMYEMEHPCIVRLIGLCISTPMMMIQELIPLGALLDFLLDHNDQCPVHSLKLWAAQIARGMVYLEEKRFVHRDLAARNILVQTLSQVKISDFGLSRAVGADSNYYKASKGGRWPIKWYAPESVNYGTFSHASDVWSYGVTLWEMFSFGQQPYEEWTGAQALNMIENQEYRLQQPEACADTTYELMLSCWSLEPESRPTFLALYNTFLESAEYGDIRKHENFYA